MIKRLIFLCLGFSFFISSNYSQTTNDTLVAYQYYKKADSLSKKKKHSEATGFYTNAIVIYENQNYWERVAHCYNKISQQNLSLLRYKLSLDAANKALKICKEKNELDSIEEAKAYTNIANCHMKTGLYKEALMDYEKAKKIMFTLLPDDHQDTVEIIKTQARLYFILGNYSNSLKYLNVCSDQITKKFGKEHFEASKIYLNIGNVYTHIGEYSNALDYYERTLSIMLKSPDENTGYLNKIYNNLAITYGNIGDYTTAINFHKKAFALKIKLYGENSLKVALSYSGIGNVYEKMGQYHLALEYHNKSLNLANSINRENIPEIPGLYNNIGLVYAKMKEYKKALHYHKKAIEINEKYHKKNHISYGDFYTSISVALNYLGKYDQAIDYLEKTIKIYELNNTLKLPDVGYSYFNLGKSYKLKGEYDLAIVNFNKAMVIYSEVYKDNHPNVAECIMHLGKTYEKKGNKIIALDFYQKVLTANHFNSLSIHENSKPDNHNDINIEIDALFSRAKVLTNLYQTNNDIESLNTALSTYSILDQLIDKNRNDILIYEDKMQFSERVSDIYENAIIAERIMSLKERKKEHFKKAFYYLEKKKANILKEFILKTEIKKDLDVPSDISSLEDRIKADQSYYKSKIIESTNSDSLSITNRERYKDRLFKVNRKHDSLTSVLQEQYQKYYQIKHQNYIISIEQIQENLKEDSTVIEFFTQDNTTYAFIISKSNFSVIELTTNNLESNIRKLRNAIISNNIKEYKNIAHTLYNNIIDPIVDLIVGNELIIVPDGPIWYLNFELLLTQNNKSEFRDMPYLLRDYAISYANSSNLLFNPLQSETKSSEIRNECLAFSFTDSTELNSAKKMSLATLRNIGDDLPGTRKEIKAISNIVNGQYFYGSEAIESNFKQNADQYSILHLALHGDVDNANPQNSKLYFTKSKDTIEDNLLYSHELFALDIPAELAVLSACNTGTGKIAKGEGIMSLGNAFQYAGTKSLLLSGWEVSDKSAPVLIENFYKNLTNGMNKAKALQQAKLDFIKTADFEQVAPFYWGNFYLLGNADPINIDQPLSINGYWIILICIIVAMLLAFVYYRKKQKFD